MYRYQIETIIYVDFPHTMFKSQVQGTCAFTIVWIHILHNSSMWYICTNILFCRSCLFHNTGIESNHIISFTYETNFTYFVENVTREVVVLAIFLSLLFSQMVILTCKLYFNCIGNWQNSILSWSIGVLYTH